MEILVIVLMKMVVMTSIFSVDEFEKVMEEESRKRVMIGEEFGLSDGVIDDIFYVSYGTDVDPLIIALTVWTESRGRYGVVRYCRKWEGRKCIQETGCRKNCRRREVWRNRLDVGMFQLRDAPIPSWSWKRWYERERMEKGEKLPKYCFIERECVLDVVTEVINQMKDRLERKSKGRTKCEGYRGKKYKEFHWMEKWNGCDSRSKKIKKILRLRKKWKK